MAKGKKPLGVPVPDRPAKGQYPASGSGANSKADGTVTSRDPDPGIGDLMGDKAPKGGVNIGKIGR